MNVSHASYPVLMRVTLFAGLVAIACTVAATFAPQSVLLLVVSIAAQLCALLLVVTAHHRVDEITDEMRDLSEKDPATGCLNRRGFAHILSEAVAQRRNVAMLALDLDYFKRINDEYGHAVGDVVLSEVSSALGSAVGSTDYVARLGGEEFGVLLVDADAEDAGVIAELVSHRFKRLQLTGMRPDDRITTSIGIAAERLETEQDCASLRVRADEALYLAKRQGRDRVRLWAPGVRSLATPDASTIALTRDHVKPMRVFAHGDMPRPRERSI